jgi:hypothetical protein
MISPEDEAWAELLDVLDRHGVRGATSITRAIEKLIDAKITKTAGMLQAQMPLKILTGGQR